MPRVVVPLAGAERRYRAGPVSPVLRCVEMANATRGDVKAAMTAAGYEFPRNLCVNETEPPADVEPRTQGYMSTPQGIMHESAHIAYARNFDVFVGLRDVPPVFRYAPDRYAPGSGPAPPPVFGFAPDRFIEQVAACRSRFFGAEILIDTEGWTHSEALVFDLERGTVEYFATGGGPEDLPRTIRPVLRNIVEVVALKIGKPLRLVPVELMYRGLFRTLGTQDFIDAFGGMCWVHSLYYTFLRALNPDAPAKRLMKAMVAGPHALRDMYRFGALVADIVCHPLQGRELRAKRHGSLKYVTVEVPALLNPFKRRALTSWVAYKEFFVDAD